MSARWTLLALALLTPGCRLVSCEHEREPASVGEPASEWPRAQAGALRATPATEVVVRADRVEVRNEALVATWPPEAMARAREASDEPDWPRVVEVIERDEPSGVAMPALRAALERTRQAERSATGAGSGAGAFNLRVASEVPFEQVERVLYAAAQAGYGTPRVLLEADDGERMVVWPSARRRHAPSRAQIEAALRGEALDTSSRAVGGRITLTNARIAARGDAPICAAEAPFDREDFERCSRALGAGHERITLEVAPDTRFDHVALALQTLVEAFDEVSVVGRPQP